MRDRSPRVRGSEAWPCGYRMRWRMPIERWIPTQPGNETSELFEREMPRLVTVQTLIRCAMPPAAAVNVTQPSAAKPSSALS